jgi:hypothetical protein
MSTFGIRIGNSADHTAFTEQLSQSYICHDVSEAWSILEAE